MDLAIIIVSYNTCNLTAGCLESVYQSLNSSALVAQVWVVDNASDDGSAEMIASRFPHARLIASQENLGFAGGNNLAMRAILQSGQMPRHILLLNPDTLVQDNAFEQMVSFLDAHDQVGIVGAQLAYGDGSFQHGAFHFPTLTMIALDFWMINHRLLNSRLNGRYPIKLYQAGQPFAIDHPLGAALMIRWQVIEQIGLLDTDFFMYCEEIDWCLRAKQAGWHAYCVPSAQVTHLEGRSARQFRNRMFIALWRSRYRLFAKHYSNLYQTLARAIVRLGMRSLIRRTQRDAATEGWDQAEVDDRMQAYRQVMEL